VFIARDPLPVATKFLFVLRGVGAAEDLALASFVEGNGVGAQWGLHSDAQAAGAEGFVFGHGR